RLLLGGGGRSQMKLDLALSSQQRGFDLGILLVDRRGALINGRFAHHCDLEDARHNGRRGGQGAQPIHALLVPHLVQFMRRSGKEHDNFSLFLYAGFQPLARRRASGIWQQRGALKHVGLLRIVPRHVNASFGKSFVQLGDDRVISLQRNSKRGGHTFAGQVVLRRSQASHKDGYVSSANGGARHRRKVVAIVTDYRFEGDADAQTIETPGEEQGIAILPVRSQHLRADGDDFGDHGTSLAAFSSWHLALSTWQLAIGCDFRQLKPDRTMGGDTPFPYLSAAIDNCRIKARDRKSTRLNSSH